MEDDYFDWTGGYQVGFIAGMNEKPTRKKKHPIGFSLPTPKPKARAKNKPQARPKSRRTR